MRIGDHASAFDHMLVQARPPKSSIEAVGGSALEAAHDVGE